MPLGVSCRPRTTASHLPIDQMRQYDLQPTRGYHSIMSIHDSLDTEAFSRLLSTIERFNVPPDPCRPAAPCYQHPYKELIPLRY